MQEEIFSPILPIPEASRAENVIDFTIGHWISIPLISFGITGVTWNLDVPLGLALGPHRDVLTRNLEIHGKTPEFYYLADPTPMGTVQRAARHFLRSCVFYDVFPLGPESFGGGT